MTANVHFHLHVSRQQNMEMLVMHPLMKLSGKVRAAQGKYFVL